MMRFPLYMLLFFSTLTLYGQEIKSNFRSKRLVASDSIVVDSLAINPSRFKLSLPDGTTIDSTAYSIDFNKALLLLDTDRVPRGDSIVVDYLRYPDYLTRDYYVFDKR